MIIFICSVFYTTEQMWKFLFLAHQDKTTTYITLFYHFKVTALLEILTYSWTHQRLWELSPHSTRMGSTFHPWSHSLLEESFLLVVLLLDSHSPRARYPSGPSASLADGTFFSQSAAVVVFGYFLFVVCLLLVFLPCPLVSVCDIKLIRRKTPWVLVFSPLNVFSLVVWEPARQ